MLRKFLLYLSTASWARNMVTKWGFARKAALRFVAGETQDHAFEVIRTLNSKGLHVTLDYLGESVANAGDTVEVVDTYKALAQRIKEEGVNADMSLKPTHLGLDISQELCFENLREITATAKANGVGVRIDMESSKHTELTLRIYRALRDEHGLDNLGTVIQAYLFRSEDDMKALAAEGAHIRIVKGAYLESPSIVFAEKADVDANFIKLMNQYLLAGPPAYLAIATHDENMIAAAEKTIRENQIPADQYEFQMLYGIRPSRQEEIAKAGHLMRVYVPFGEAWYPYFVRRLAERPANVWFFVKSFFSR
jgi:proline dehydrogenase